MFTLLRRGRFAGPSAVRRPRLEFDTLESRDCPSAWDVSLPPGYSTGSEPDRSGGSYSLLGEVQTTPRPINAAPVIHDFDAEAMGDGMYVFTGWVEDEYPAGMVVTFSGVPTLEGQTATVGPDGTFTLAIQLRTDGSDAGTVSVVTYDNIGQKSNEPCLPVNP